MAIKIIFAFEGCDFLQVFRSPRVAGEASLDIPRVQSVTCTNVFFRVNCKALHERRLN